MRKVFITHSSPHRKLLAATMMAHAHRNYLDLFDSCMEIVTHDVEDESLLDNPTFEIILGASPCDKIRIDLTKPHSKPYHRAWTKNFAAHCAIKAYGDDCLLFFNDDDFCFTREGVEFALHYAETAKAAAPFWLTRCYHGAADRDGRLDLDNPLKWDPYTGLPFTAGAFAITARTFWAHGGFFEGLTGWGLEDNILEWVLWKNTPPGQLCTAPQNAIHLRHPRRVLEGGDHPYMRLNHSIWRHTVIDPAYYPFHLKGATHRGLLSTPPTYDGSEVDMAFFADRLQRWGGGAAPARPR